MHTLKVKPWGQGQGDYVIINAQDFDPSIHAVLDAQDQAAYQGGIRKDTKQNKK
jgi:hypothetical protein